MRYLLKFSILAILLVSFTTSAEAQLLKRLKKKAQQAAEQKAEEKLAEEVERRAEQMVEKSWNTIFGDLDEAGKDGRNFMFNMNSNVATEDNYRFDTITTMEIETVRKDGKSDPPMIMEMHFSENEMYTGSKFKGEDIDKSSGEVFIIYDFKNSAMVMLMNSDDEKFSFAYDWKQAVQFAEENESNESESEKENENEVDWDEVKEWNGYTKIGTKNISGYSSDGYRSENEQTTTEIWVTREAAYGMSNMFQANANAKQLRGKVPADYPYGMLMEMVSENLKSGDITTMKVTDVKKNANVAYLMSDYPTMSLGKKEKKD